MLRCFCNFKQIKSYGTYFTFLSSFCCGLCSDCLGISISQCDYRVSAVWLFRCFQKFCWRIKNCHFNLAVDRNLVCGLNSLCRDWHGGFYVGGTIVSSSSPKPFFTTPPFAIVLSDVGFCCVIPFRSDLGWIII